MAPDAPRKLSPAQRALGFLLLGVAIVGGFFLGWLAMRATSCQRAEAPPAQMENVLLHAVLMMLLGGFSLFVAVVGYLALIGTRCFLFDFSTPAWGRLKPRIWLANVIVPLCLLLAVGCLTSMIVTPMLRAFGLGMGLAFAVPFFGVLVVGQIVLAFLNVWLPVTVGVARSRLLARGIPTERLGRGQYVGVSDPDASTLKRLFVEQDIGMLWLDADRLLYAGDDERWDLDVPREGLLEIERAVNAGSWAAYWGATDVILRVRSQGSERRMRLHPQRAWTMRSLSRALDRLAEDLSAWKSAPGPTSEA